VSWPTATLGDCGEIQGGLQVTSKRQPLPLSRPYLRVANVHRGRLDLTEIKAICVTQAEADRTRLQPGDLLFVEGHANPHEVGRVAVWDGSVPDCVHQNHLIRVRLDPSVLLPAFAVAWFNSPAGASHFRRAGKTTSGLNTISANTVRSAPTLLPPLDEQRRIAAMLDHADALCAKRRKMMSDLTSLECSIYWSMFEGRKWPKVKLTDLCSTPEDVRCGPFGTQLQKSEVVHQGVPLWGIKNVNSGFKLPAFEFLEDATAKRLNQYSVIPGDIVMTRKGTIGNCAVYPNTRPAGIMHSDLLRVRLDSTRARPIFVSHQLHHDPKVAAQISRMSSGAIMPGINVGKLKGLEVIVPPLDIQLAFEHGIKSLETLRAQSFDCLDQLDNLFASLQFRAFSGQL